MFPASSFRVGTLLSMQQQRTNCRDPTHHLLRQTNSSAISKAQIPHWLEGPGSNLAGAMSDLFVFFVAPIKGYFCPRNVFCFSFVPLVEIIIIMKKLWTPKTIVWCSFWLNYAWISQFGRSTLLGGASQFVECCQTQVAFSTSWRFARSKYHRRCLWMSKCVKLSCCLLYSIL